MFRVSTVLSLLAAVVLFVAGCSASRSGSTSSAASANVVAIIAGEPLTTSEFESEYARSVGTREMAAADSMAEYEDFLERYVNYRIKVLEAKDAGLESDSAIVAELASYRTQYAKPYLINQKVLDPIIQKLYERSLDMVEASHILLRTSQNQPPADTLSLFNKLTAIRDSALAGVDFGALAVRHSEDPSAQQESSPLGYRGYLGYFTSGSMVPQFEEWAYKTPAGELSPVFRTRFGYHVLRVSDRKPTPNDISISHIMITPKSAAKEDSMIAKVVIDSLYQQTSRGEDFAALATAFSDDKQSGAKGGSLGVVNYGSRLVPELKDAAFALPEVGAVTKPILTRFGYHIIRLDEIAKRKTFDEAYEELKTAASRTSEAAEGEKLFADSVLIAVGATIDSVFIFDALAGLLPDSIADLQNTMAIPKGDSVVATIDSTQFTMKDLVNGVAWKRYRTLLNKSAKEIQRIVLLDYMRQRAIDHEVGALEGKDDNFRATMKEFRNGILLFRLMEDSIWTAAATDTMALQRAFDKDPTRFQYPDRTRLVTYFSNNKAPLTVIAENLRNKQLDLVPDSVLAAVRVDTTFLSGTSNSIYDRGLEQPVGADTGILAYNSGSIIIVNDGVEPARSKTFDESRAELISIVQEEKETILISRLRSKFGVATFPAHLDGVFRDVTASNASNEH